jgi:cytoskeletal protein CcmA (bactofilin family)
MRSALAYIKNIFSKKREEKAQELPYKDELHLSGILIQRDMVALDDVCVTRNVTGDIYCTKNIVVCKNIQVVGNIYCRSCVLEGSINGSIFAYEALEIKADAILSGNINTRNLNVSPMAVLNGYIANINVKDSRRIHADIKLKTDNVKQLNKGKASAIPETPDIERVRDSPELDLTQKTSIPESKPERINQIAAVENNDKWW